MISRLNILYSFGPPTEEANPYVRLLAREVAPAVNVHYFSWQFALLGSYDIFHVHWPEALVRRKTVKGRVASLILMSLLLVRLAATRTPIVRTEHNLHPHEPGGWFETQLLGALDRRTAIWVVMNTGESNGPAAKRSYIPHGHYREWYEIRSAPQKTEGVILNFGLLRPYKGVEDLIAAFSDIPPSSKSFLKLKIMGKPQTLKVRQDVMRCIADDAHISADLRHIPDEELVDEISKAQLVALPYRSMHNSGALLMALSLNTAVLVPRSHANDSLAAEVGEEWVQRYEAQLTPKDILRASQSVANLTGSPNLSGRQWSLVGARHIEVYNSAVER